jgi:hypothetical protein
MIVGILVALYGVYAIYRGRIASGDENSTSYISRAEKPVQFWISIVILYVVAAILIFNVFHL